jgi:predicted AAA+ superfamily ATPase
MPFCLDGAVRGRLQVSYDKANESMVELKSEFKALTDAISDLSKELSKGLKPSKLPAQTPTAPTESNAFVLDAETQSLRNVERISAPPLDLLKGIDRAKQTLLDNTLRFANGYSANNALLWGARGMGKSTLVKSIHLHLQKTHKTPTSLVEIHREDISALPRLLLTLKDMPGHIIIFCDDLSFNRPDSDFKALKSVLEGGLEGRPENVLFYATSNRRHLLPRQMMDQEKATGIHPNESMDETIALSDRFGLWLGFHACDQDDYLSMITDYMLALDLVSENDWTPDALEWAKTRGNRSGRTAWQFVQHLAGTMDKNVRF